MPRYKYYVHENIRRYYDKYAVVATERFLYLWKVVGDTTVEDIEIPRELHEYFDKLYDECEEKQECWIERTHDYGDREVTDYRITEEIYNKIKKRIETMKPREAAYKTRVWRTGNGYVVSIPKHIREYLDLKQGDEVVVIIVKK